MKPSLLSSFIHPTLAAAKSKKDEDRLLLLRIKSVSFSPSNFALIKNARTHGRCAKTERCTPRSHVIYLLLGVYCWLGRETRQRRRRLYCSNILQNTSITWIVKFLRPAVHDSGKNKTSAENNSPLNMQRSAGSGLMEMSIRQKRSAEDIARAAQSAKRWKDKCKRCRRTASHARRRIYIYIFFNSPN
jgi:hypothetical protein